MPVTNYIYNPLTEAYLMETDGDGNVTAWYTQEPVKYGDIHAQRRIDPAAGVGQSYYYHPDALGSTRELTDASGDLVATYNYDAFGNTIASTGTVENPFRFTGNVGYYWDEELQTYHIRARNYEPITGRWTSQDPIGFAGGNNLYGAYFVPFGTDPSGLNPAIPILGGLTALEAAAAFFGISLLECLRRTRCRELAVQKMQDAVNGLSKAAIEALKLACDAHHKLYKASEALCRSCHTGRADTFCGRYYHCNRSTFQIACWSGVAGQRLSYIASGCDFVLHNKFEVHITELEKAIAAVERCTQSIFNNCVRLFPETRRTA